MGVTREEITGSVFKDQKCSAGKVKITYNQLELQNYFSRAVKDVLHRMRQVTPHIFQGPYKDFDHESHETHERMKLKARERVAPPELKLIPSDLGPIAVNLR